MFRKSNKDKQGKKKVKEIVGDSTGMDAAQKITEWLDENTSYEEFYSIPPYGGKSKFSQEMLKRRRALNCTDCGVSEEDYMERQRIIKKLQEMQEQRRMKQ